MQSLLMDGLVAVIWTRLARGETFGEIYDALVGPDDGALTVEQSNALAELIEQTCDAMNALDTAYPPVTAA
jgi:hypothetical protein